MLYVWIQNSNITIQTAKTMLVFGLFFKSLLLLTAKVLQCTLYNWHYWKTSFNFSFCLQSLQRQPSFTLDDPICSSRFYPKN